MSDRRKLSVQIKAQDGTLYAFAEWLLLVQQLKSLAPHPDSLLLGVIYEDLGDLDDRQAAEMVAEAIRASEEASAAVRAITAFMEKAPTQLDKLRLEEAHLKDKLQESTETYLGVLNQAPALIMRSGKQRAWESISSHAKNLLEVQRQIAALEAKA
jgi:hypothetical protein